MATPIDLKTAIPNFIFTPNAVKALGSAGIGVNGLIEPTLNYLHAVHRLRITLTAVQLQILDANAYGSLLLGYLPNLNLICFGGEANLSCVKDGTGILTTELPKLAVGTAAASNATLSSTMSNIINGGATAGTALATGGTATWRFHSQDNVTSIPYIGIADSTTTGVYLNAAVNPTGDGYMTITGTIDLFFLNLGNVNAP